jgi:hypothetical protein
MGTLIAPKIAPPKHRLQVLLLARYPGCRKSQPGLPSSAQRKGVARVPAMTHKNLLTHCMSLGRGMLQPATCRPKSLSNICLAELDSPGCSLYLISGLAAGPPQWANMVFPQTC